jgi:hypothetical protein
VFRVESENREKLKGTIVPLMKHISKQLIASKNLPNVSQLAEMQVCTTMQSNL